MPIEYTVYYRQEGVLSIRYIVADSYSALAESIPNDAHVEHIEYIDDSYVMPRRACMSEGSVLCLNDLLRRRRAQT